MQHLRATVQKPWATVEGLNYLTGVVNAAVLPTVSLLGNSLSAAVLPVVVKHVSGTPAAPEGVYTPIANFSWTDASGDWFLDPFSADTWTLHHAGTVFRNGIASSPFGRYVQVGATGNVLDIMACELATEDKVAIIAKAVGAKASTILTPAPGDQVGGVNGLAQTDEAPSASTIATAVWSVAGSALDALADTTIGKWLRSILSAIRNPSGNGATPVTLTIKLANGQPVYNVSVALYTEQACTHQVPGTGTQFTNQQGIVVFYLDSGTYWAKKTLRGTQFRNNPQRIIVP